MIDIIDINWIIKVHPAEKKMGSVFTSEDLIRKHFNDLPSHIKILDASYNLNSYDLYIEG